MVVIFDMGPSKAESAAPIDELSGKPGKSSNEALMHTVMDNDKEEIDDGRMIVESINQGINSFTPDIIFRNIVKNYQMAKNLYGETLIRKLTGYDPNYVKKNINIPEFTEEIKGNISDNVDRMEKKDMIDKEGRITESALKLSSLVMYMEELDRLKVKGGGLQVRKRKDPYGEKEDVKEYKDSRYRDLALKQTVKQSIRRGHDKIEPEDLRVYNRKKKGKVSIIYAIDSSGSMKGKKIGAAKKAGIALAYKAIQEKNDVGIISFNSIIEKSIAPCGNFNLLLESLAGVKAARETDLAKTVRKSVEMFPRDKGAKHLTLLTDAMPTSGNDPVKNTMEAVSFARDNGITLSLIGINLDREGLELAQKMVEVGQGRLYRVSNVEDMDYLVLEDYYSFS